MDRMSRQVLDLRRSVQIVRRHKKIVIFAAVLGVVAGVALTLLNQPMFASQTLVALPSQPVHNVQTEVVVADSGPVLASAMRRVDPAMSLAVLRSRVGVSSVTSDILEIHAQGTTAVEARDIANAVANSYISYIRHTTSPSIPGIPGAWVLEPATSATGTPLLARLLVGGGLGALLGMLAGAIVALAVGSNDRRLWGRDEIAHATGVPVLASIPVGHPANVAGWRRLIEGYEPGALYAWSLQKVLDQLGLTGAAGRSGATVAVVSLSSDPRALALGPQLASFAASRGVPTTLVIDRQQAGKPMALLRTACTAASATPSRCLANFLTTIGDQEEVGRQPEAALTVIVAIVDGQAPRVAYTMPTATTVLGVSAGAATAEQLAGAAVSAADGSRNVAGIIMADPDPTDPTTGRVPQPTWPAPRRLPTRLIGVATEAGQ
jgi:capsular polysaccharide biosynthesis protein